MVQSDTQILKALDVELTSGPPQEAPARDRLTGMLSREALLVRLEQTIARAAAQPRSGFALLFLDLDGFKLVNHGRGAAGDARQRRRASRRR
jgi:GGDEF domain-containing protein